MAKWRRRIPTKVKKELDKTQLFLFTFVLYSTLTLSLVTQSTHAHLAVLLKKNYAHAAVSASPNWTRLHSLTFCRCMVCRWYFISFHWCFPNVRLFIQLCERFNKIEWKLWWKFLRKYFLLWVLIIPVFRQKCRCSIACSSSILLFAVHIQIEWQESTRGASPKTFLKICSASVSNGATERLKCSPMWCTARRIVHVYVIPKSNVKYDVCEMWNTSARTHTHTLASTSVDIGCILCIHRILEWAWAFRDTRKMKSRPKRLTLI